LKILRVIPSINPEYGGPVEGVNQVSAAYREMGVEVDICSLDRQDTEWVRNSRANVYALGPALWKYAYSSRLIPWLKAHAHEYDAVTVHGLWQYTGYAVWRALAGSVTPYYVFTHGMLDPWFKHTYPLKHLKKWLYWACVEYRVLRDARKVIFTCDEERLLARESFWLYKVNEAVTNYGVANPPANADELGAAFLAQYPHLQGTRIALYLSRIHVKKGCDLLIQAFAKIAQRDENVHLVMAGPDPTGWMPELKAQAEALNVAHRITWPGMLQGKMKWGAYYAAEVFCLPSHQENFGIVVAEALGCGKPVLISNRVNIWREIDADGAGFVADDTLAGTIMNFERWLGLSPEAFHAMKVQATSCFANRFHVQRAAKRLLEIIEGGASDSARE
jgi:glycosyltransferase involved in cell wall biosynthesis